MVLLTPRGLNVGERLSLDVSTADAAKAQRGKNWRATVTDRNTGTRYRLRGAACPAKGCMCDAVVVRVLDASAE